MKAYDHYNSLSNKLEELCAKQLLTFDLDKTKYPLVLTIRPDKSPDAQMAMYSQDDGASSADASLEYSFSADGIDLKINGRLCLPDEAMNKIKGTAKKMVAAYLFGYFADQRASKNGDDINYSGNAEDTETEAADAAFDGFFDGEPADDAAASDNVTEE